MYTKYLTLWPLGGPQCEPCEDFRDFAELDRLCVANVGSWVRAEFGRLSVTRGENGVDMLATSTSAVLESKFAPPGHWLRC
jgi:hypothetical protein